MSVGTKDTPNIPKLFIFKKSSLVMLVSILLFLIISQKSIYGQAINDQDYIEHIVKQGETLFSISKKYKVYIDEIIGSQDVIYIGQVLKVPKKSRYQDIQVITKDSLTSNKLSEVQINNQTNQNIEIYRIENELNAIKSNYNIIQKQQDSLYQVISSLKNNTAKLNEVAVDQKESKKTPNKIFINAELRTRYEYRNGYATLRLDDSKPANIIAQRSRIVFGTNGDKISTKLSFQDVRIFGEVQVKKDVSTTFIHEAWGQINLSKNFKFKIGRQLLNYDDFRLFASTNWNNVGTSHDLMLFDFNKSNFKLHLGFAYNNDIEKNFETFYPIKNYKSMGFIWISKTSNLFDISLINILDGNQKDSSNYVVYGRNTIGPNVALKLKSIDLIASGNFYYQNGKDNTGKDINAHFYSAKIKKNFFKNYSTTIGYDFYSGTDALDKDNKTINTFNKLYGAGHKYLGSMDYFTDTYTQTKKAGISDLYLSIDLKVTKQLSSNISAHYFNLANNVIDPKTSAPNQTALDKYLGTEVDFLLKYKYSDDAIIEMGYAFLIASESMEVIKGGNSENFNNWFYLMLTFTPTIYNI